MEVRFLPSAELEFIKKLAYYSKARPNEASKLEGSVETPSQMALRHPHGEAPSYKGARAFPVNGFPFSLVYRTSAHEVLIVAIAPHSKKKQTNGPRALTPNPSDKRSANGMSRWPSSAGPVDHFALAVQRAIPSSPA